MTMKLNCLPLGILFPVSLLGCGEDLPTPPARSTSPETSETAFRRDPKIKVEWSPRERTLQETVDAAPDGATVEIPPGEYRMDTPVFIRGKRLVVSGAGAGRDGEPRVTRMTGPEPRAVLDREGRLALPASDVQGMFNAIGAQLVVRDMVITGHDAGIVSRDDPGGPASQVDVHDVVIDGTGRGILVLSSGPAVIQDVLVSKTLWHGISICSPEEVTVFNVHVTDLSAVGMFFCETYAIVADSDVLYAQDGGIFMIRTGGWILDTNVYSARKFGIGIVESDLVPTSVLLTDDTVVFTQEVSERMGGDGIVGLRSTVSVYGTTSSGNDRAGILNLAGTMTLGDCTFECNVGGAWDLEGEILNGIPYQFINSGGIACGCPASTGGCVVQTTGYAPPAPITDP